jgi:AcrR family transcriptional regulator
MPPRRTARERVRAEITREIADIARDHLAAGGAAGLSLRAVARDMGMVSSAIYRYFPSRDDLLTALITDGYNAIGAAVEAADAACRRDDYPGRWLAGARAAREWALARPHEYALIYGSPVPGYQAPADTIGPASRTAVVFGRLVSDACAAGALSPPQAAPPQGDPIQGDPIQGDQPDRRPARPGRPARPARPAHPVPATLSEDAARLRGTVMPGVPDDVVFGALTAWAGLFGIISFELFGQFTNVVTDRGAYFDHAAGALAGLMGLAGP